MFYPFNRQRGNHSVTPLREYLRISAKHETLTPLLEEAAHRLTAYTTKGIVDARVQSILTRSVGMAANEARAGLEC